MQRSPRGQRDVEPCFSFLSFLPYLVRVGHGVALSQGQLELETTLVDLDDGCLHELVLLHDCLHVTRLEKKTKNSKKTAATTEDTRKLQNRGRE